MYWYSVGWKIGKEWWGEGSLVFYVLYIDHFVIFLVVWLRENYFVIQFFMWGTVVVESLGVAIGLLVPWGPLCMVGCFVVIGMYIGFILIFEIGLFWAILFICWVFFFLSWFWDKMEVLFNRWKVVEIIILVVAGQEWCFKLFIVICYMLFLELWFIIGLDEVGVFLCTVCWGVWSNGWFLIVDVVFIVFFKVLFVFFLVWIIVPVLYFVYSVIDMSIGLIEGLFLGCECFVGCFGDWLVGWIFVV